MLASFYLNGNRDDEILRRSYNDKGYLIKEERYVQGQELVNVSNYGGFLENGKPTWCEQEYYEKKKVVSKEHVDYVLVFLVSFSLSF